MREYFCLYTTSKWVYYHVIAYLTGGCKPYNVSNLLVTPLIKGGTRNVWRGTQNTRRHFCSLFFCWTFSYLISKGNPDYRIFFPLYWNQVSVCQFGFPANDFRGARPEIPYERRVTIKIWVGQCFRLDENLLHTIIGVKKFPLFLRHSNLSIIEQLFTNTGSFKIIVSTFGATL